MANRCTRTTNLEVHHKRRNGGNGLENAQVMCQKCHAATHTYGTPGHSPEPFPQSVKDQALKNSGYRCECTNDYGCH